MKKLGRLLVIFIFIGVYNNMKEGLDFKQALKKALELLAFGFVYMLMLPIVLIRAIFCK